ncbi:hypothetical protein D3C81_1617310 [compost metagenome]
MMQPPHRVKSATKSVTSICPLTTGLMINDLDSNVGLLVVVLNGSRSRFFTRYAFDRITGFCRDLISPVKLSPRLIEGAEQRIALTLVLASYVRLR